MKRNVWYLADIPIERLRGRQKFKCTPKPAICYCPC